jgi:hypothetical protein
VGSQPFTSMSPSDAEASRRPYPSSTAPPLRQIISNARGRFPQLEMFNVPRTPTKQRGDDKVQHVDTVMERLEVVSCMLHLTFAEDAADTFISRWDSMKHHTQQCALRLSRTSLLMEVRLRKTWRMLSPVRFWRKSWSPLAPAPVCNPRVRQSERRYVLAVEGKFQRSNIFSSFNRM